MLIPRVLKFTRRTEYGLMALALMAGRPGDYLSVRAIVASLGLPHRLLAEVLKHLAQAELLEAARGPGGGYRLRVAPASISLAEVIATLEGPVQVTACRNGQPCDIESTCIIRRGISTVAHRIEEVLAGFSLEDLVGERNGQACSDPAAAPGP